MPQELSFLTVSSSEIGSAEVIRHRWSRSIAWGPRTIWIPIFPRFRLCIVIMHHIHDVHTLLIYMTFHRDSCGANPLKLVQVSQSHKTIFEALGRNGCPEICVSIRTAKNEWRGFSDVYYQLVAQTRLPWATYAKLANYLVEKGFVEKKTEPVKGRNAIFLRLTDLGQELVSTYMNAQGKTLADLKS